MHRLRLDIDLWGSCSHMYLIDDDVLQYLGIQESNVATLLNETTVSVEKISQSIESVN